MACAPVLTAEVRGAWPAIAPRVAIGSDTAGRLICLLALSLALHLALLGWPTRWHAVAGPRALATHGTQLSATLIPPAASAPAVAAIVRREAPPLGLAPRRVAQAAASAPVADVASPARVLPAELASAPTPNLPIMPAATPYYPAELLTTRPRALVEPELDPDPLAAYVASGEIALTLWINEHGTVTELHVESSDLPDVFTRTAAAAFRDVRFVPGEIDGHAVGSVLRIAVRYDDERLAGEHDPPPPAAVEPAT